MVKAGIWQLDHTLDTQRKPTYILHGVKPEADNSASTNANASLSPEVDIVRSPRLHKMCELDNLSVPSLVAEFDAIDLRHDASDQVVDKKSSTERVTSASMPTETVYTTSSDSRLPPAKATRESGPTISAVGSALLDQDEGHDSDEYNFEGVGYNSVRFGKSYGYDSDDQSDQDQDFTACSADDCGYCGKCMY